MNKTTATIVAAVVLACAVPAMGQVSPERVDPNVAPPPTAAGARAQAPIGEAGKLSWALSGAGSYTFGADLEDDRGDVAITRGGAELTLAVPVSETTRVNVGLTNEWSWYDFGRGDAPIAVVGGEEGTEVYVPFSQVTSLRLSPGFLTILNRQWAIIGGVTIDASGETDADVGESLIVSGFAGARYAVNEKLALTFGLSAATQLEDDVRVLPLLGVQWEFAEGWSFLIAGPGARVIWMPTEKLDLSVSVSYEGRSFRLSDDASIRDGVVRDRRVVAGVQAQYAVLEWLTVRGEVGVVGWSELEFDDRDGDGLGTYTVDPTGYVGASLTARW